MSRRSRRRGLQVASGERYALLPREVLESAAYHALPDWARTVLTALAAQFYGTRNGSLALPVDDAFELGVRRPWQLYAGLRLLQMVNLAVCTRQGHLAAGGKLASLYALTWRGIDEPRDNITYDAGIAICPIPTHAWAHWTRPDDWDMQVRAVVDRVRGERDRERALAGLTDRIMRAQERRKNPVSPSVGTTRTPRVGTDVVHSDPQRGYGDVRFSYPKRGEPLRSRSGVRDDDDARRRIHRLARMHPHLPDSQIAQACHTTIELVAEVRRAMEGRR